MSLRPDSFPTSVPVTIVYTSNNTLLYVMIAVICFFVLVVCCVAYRLIQRRHAIAVTELQLQKLRETNAISDYRALFQSNQPNDIGVVHQVTEKINDAAYYNEVPNENESYGERFEEEDFQEFIIDEIGNDNYNDNVSFPSSSSFHSDKKSLYKSRIIDNNLSIRKHQDGFEYMSQLAGGIDIDDEHGLQLFKGSLVLPSFLKSPDGKVYQDDVEIIDWTDLYLHDDNSMMMSSNLVANEPTAVEEGTLPPSQISQANYRNVRNQAKDENVLGKGAFGTVIKTKLRMYNGHIAVRDPKNYFTSSKATAAAGAGLPSSSCRSSTKSDIIFSEVDVAVKVLIRKLTTDDEEAFEKLKTKAFEEVFVLQKAYSHMLHREGIVRTYGLACGNLSAQISDMFQMQHGSDAIGIVMKYEGGGTLEKYIFSRHLYGHEKIRIMENIARGLSELHALGIVHADIKPENVLLSTDSPPQVRLADFGLSMLKPKPYNDLNRSSVEYGHKSRGTPIYFAPEMLWTPSLLSGNGHGHGLDKKEVAKSSKKTDMYAFAILSWEIVSQKPAFQDIETAVQLSQEIHAGTRPRLNQISGDIPPDVIRMMKKCWNVQRSLRYTAIECLSLLQKTGPRKHFDIYFSYCPDIPSTTKSSKRDENNLLSSNKMKSELLKNKFGQYNSLTAEQTEVMYRLRYYSVAKTILHHLIRIGYRVCYDDDAEVHNISEARKSRIQSNIGKSNVFVAFGTSNYQASNSCMYELNYASSEWHITENLKLQQLQESSYKLSRIHNSTDSTGAAAAAATNTTVTSSRLLSAASMKKTFFSSATTTPQSDAATAAAAADKAELDRPPIVTVQPKPIITLVGEEDVLSWANADFLRCTGLLGKVKYADVSQMNPDYIPNETVPTGECLIVLQQILQPLFKLLKEKNCEPTLNVLSKIAD